MEFQEHKVLMLCESGSKAYGLNHANSDVDTRGVFMNTRAELMGFKSCNTIETPDDTKLFSLRRFCELAMKGHSGTLELLGLEPELYQYKTDIWDKLVENQELFLSQRLKLMAMGNEKTQEKEIAKKLALNDYYRAGKYMSHVFRIYDFAIRSAETRRFVAKPPKEAIDFFMEVKNGLYVVDGQVSPNYEKMLDFYRKKCDETFERVKLPENCDLQHVEGLLIKLTERGLYR